MVVSPDRWTCPNETCGDTVVRGATTSETTWKRQLKAMRREHGRKHRPRRVTC